MSCGQRHIIERTMSISAILKLYIIILANEDNLGFENFVTNLNLKGKASITFSPAKTTCVFPRKNSVLRLIFRKVRCWNFATIL